MKVFLAGLKTSKKAKCTSEVLHLQNSEICSEFEDRYNACLMVGLSSEMSRVLPKDKARAQLCHM